MEFKNNEMERIYAETFRQIREGLILTGRVISVKPNGVIVDVGYKSEGFIKADEFSPEELANLKAGDVFDVYVVSMRDSEGTMSLSRDKASKIKTWDVLEAAFEKGETIEGSIVGKTKGGLTVDIKGVNAFLPGSQMDTKAIKDVNALFGKMMGFKILKLNNKR
ncbi:MAG: S1 RNA-binding domain-containing protein, partial [Thermodesulfovibrionales bacterium]